MVQMKASSNRMSIEHILCPQYNTPCTRHGLPSPVLTCYGSEEEDASTTLPLISTQWTLKHTRTHSNKSAGAHRHRRQEILPYRSHRRTNLHSKVDQARSGEQKRFPWLPEEDNLLTRGFEQGLSWAMIASTYLPHRSRGCCWGRFRTLKNKKFLNVRRHIRVLAKPWKSLNPMDMQASL